MTVPELMERLLVECPHWTNQQAYDHARFITAHAEQMAFQIEVERDIAALPTMEAA